MKMMRSCALLCTIILIQFYVQPVLAQTANHVVVSEIYGGGGNSGSTYTNDFVELHNPTSSPVNLGGWSVQYGSATGTSSWQVTVLTGTIAPHGFFLVGEAAGTGGSVSLPTPDVVGTLTLSSTAGKIALVNSVTALNGANPTGASIVDKVGFGATANGYEGSGPAPAPSNSTSIERKANSASTSNTMAVGGSDELAGNGYDSDNNASDFVTRANPQPQNSSGPPEPSLSVGGNGTGTASISPLTVNAKSTSSFTIAVAGDGTNTLDSLIVILPSLWTWPESAGSISLAGSVASSVVAVSGDTIFVGHAAITKTDTGKITIASLTAPDTAITSAFIIESGLNGGTPVQISSHVMVSVLKIVPIIDLHINDSQGVPVSPFQVGATVTISGIVTADFNATYTNIFVQDATAGVCVYRAYRSYNYQVGDSVTVTGTITQFRGLVEVSLDSTKYVFYSSGNALPVPFLLTAHDVNETFNTDIFTEPNEGRLVRINDVTYNAAGGTITDATGTTAAFLPATWTTPTGTFDLIGILKQYKPGTPVTAPYTSNYEIDPRTSADIILHPGPVYKTLPFESNIQATSVTINGPTLTPSTETVKYGLTTSYTDSATSAIDTVHAVSLKNLKPSTVYHYQVIASDVSGSDATGDAIFITGSTSTDSLRIYFNKTVSYSVALAESAKVTDLSKVLLYRISKAQYSIDMCTYSCSGTVGANVASAILAARNRGVKVRVIGEHDNITTAPWNTLKNAGVIVIDDAYDLIDAGAGLMHDKFYVIDHRDTASSRVDWVIMGSWNATDPGTNDDAQNMVEIQDRSLAEAYTLEFNQMWGSSGDSPNQAASRFGFRKADITPHRFVLGGVPVESYFSPSDKTTSKILAVLNAATSSINICMLTFTRDDLAQALIAKKTASKKVHVVLDNNTDTGNEFATLKNAGVDVLLKASSLTGLLHHKYAVIDADVPSEGNVVVTGSHNWSSSAETANDENTLILHSKRIANLYLQEFKQRYVDAGGSDGIVLSVKSLTAETPASYELQQNYPNPFNPSTRIQFSIVDARIVTVKVYDILGREVATLVNERMIPGVYTVMWNAARLSSGIYFVRLQAGTYTAVRKVVLMK